MNDHFIAKLEAEGEESVRRKLAGGSYPAEPYAARTMVEYWLAKKDQARSEAFSLDQTRIARSSKNAAWVAAYVAIMATIIAAIPAAEFFFR